MANAPNALATKLHQKIKEQEGSQPPNPAETLPRVELYAALAKRFTNAGGYANHVLADTLNTLAILHIARLLADDPTQVADCRLC